MAALAPFIVSRVIVDGATIVGDRVLRAGAVDTTGTQIPEAALRPFYRFDAIWYHSLWQTGYSGPRSVFHSAFYPVYPALVRAVGLVMGNDLAALVLSHVAFLIALVLIYRIARQYLTPETATLSVWVLALWPWSIFYSYPYGESTELLLVAAVFLLMERGSYVWAGALAAVAGASRPSGILTSAAFAGEFAERLWRRKALASVVVGGLLSPLGLAAFCLLLWRATGNPFGFLHAQTLWVGAHPRNPLFPVTSVARLITRHDIFDTEAPAFLVVLAFIGALIWAFRRLPFRYVSWGAAFLVVAVFHGYYVRSFAAVPRHLLEWFPAYFALALWIRASPHPGPPPRAGEGRGALRLRANVVWTVWLAISAVVLALYAAMFGSWHFVS